MATVSQERWIETVGAPDIHPGNTRTVTLLAHASAIRHVRKGPELLRIRGHGGIDTLPVRHGVVCVEEVGLAHAGAGAVVGDEVLARHVARLKVAAVEADGGHAAVGQLQAAETVEIGNFDGHGPAVGVRVSPQPEVGDCQNGLEERYGHHISGRGRALWRSW